jgi:hypothetical protein
MADTVISKQISDESNELREAALKLRVIAASLIERAMELEEQVAQVERHSQEQGEAA